MLKNPSVLENEGVVLVAHVVNSSGVIYQCLKTVGQIIAPGRFHLSALKPLAVLLLPGGVVKKRINTVGRVIVAGFVAETLKERPAYSRRWIGKERIKTVGALGIAGLVLLRTFGYGGRVADWSRC